MENQHLSPIQELDEVLKFLAVSPSARPFVTDRDIHQYLKSVSLDGDELLRILNKLRKDNYIDCEDRPKVLSNGQIHHTNKIRVYWITWDGKLYGDGGGYKEEIVRRGQEVTQEVKRIKAVEEEQRKTSVFLRKSQIRIELATWVLAIGSLVLAIIEILKFFSDNN